MKETNTLVIGASIAGLAVSACLCKQKIDYLILEKEAAVATPWRNHYKRLHLHTNKRVSHLPFLKMAKDYPRYPSRQQVVDYLDAYRSAFNINPVFSTQALSLERCGDHWTVDTNGQSFKSRNLVMATGVFHKPNSIQIPGMDSFPGKIFHSSEYKTGADFTSKKVLVVGFGNSACEIAIDLYEQGAMPAMSVRSAVNIIPRDVLGIPVLELSLVLKGLPPWLADKLSAPLVNALVGNITKLGLRKMPYGPIEQICRYADAPVLDIGTIKHIRKGHIKIYDGIDFIEGSMVHFKKGNKDSFDTIVAAIGFSRDNLESLVGDKARIGDLKYPLSKQKYFGKDGLYFCGYWISPTGQIREIGLDAQRIVDHIAKNRRL